MRRGSRRKENDANSNSSSGRLSYFLFGVVFGLLSSLSLILFFSIDKNTNLVPLSFLAKPSEPVVVHSMVNDKVVQHVAKQEPRPVVKKHIPVSFVSVQEVNQAKKNMHLRKKSSPEHVKLKENTDVNYEFYKALSDGAEKKEAKPKVSNVSQVNSYFLRAASFKSEKEALSLKSKLSKSGYKASIQVVKINSVQWSRVVIGPFDTIKDAYTAKNSLLVEGVKAVMVKGGG